jgi:hypothetical protein
VIDNLRLALANYEAERRRIVGGPHPTLACSCGQCDVIRAADLLYSRVLAERAARRWRAPLPKTRAAIRRA